MMLKKPTTMFLKKKSNLMNITLTHTVGRACEDKSATDILEQILTGIPEETGEEQILTGIPEETGESVEILRNTTSPVKSDLVKYNPIPEACGSNNVSVEESNLFNTETHAHEIEEVISENVTDTVQDFLLSLPEESKCTLCHRVFKDKGKLKQHMIVHTGERKNICPACNSRFHYKWTLIQHVKSCCSDKLQEIRYVENNDEVGELTTQTINASTSVTATPSPSSNLPNRTTSASKRQCNPIAEEAYAAMKMLGEKIRTKDEFDVFGEHVAYQLRKFANLADLAVAKQNIRQVLSDLETPSLNRHNQDVTSTSRDYNKSGDKATICTETASFKEQHNSLYAALSPDEEELFERSFQNLSGIYIEPTDFDYENVAIEDND